MRFAPGKLPDLIGFWREFWREQRCFLCSVPVAGAPADDPAPVCAACRASLRDAPPGETCPRCGETLAAPGAASPLCAACLADPPPWTSFHFFGPYNGYLRRLLLQIKFGRGLHQAEALGRLLAEEPTLRAAAAACDCLTPLPLHPDRLRERGFNQAQLLAAPLARRLKLPLRPQLLRRTVDSPSQSGLSRAQRRENMRGIFAAAPETNGLRILLLDDVLTTGATLRSAAHCLLQAGAACVHAAVFGRTAH